MNKNTLHILLVVLAIFAGATLKNYTAKESLLNDQFSNVPNDRPDQQPEPNQPKLTKEQALELIKSEKIKKDLYYLASDELEGRMSGKKGNVVAAAFIKEYCEKLGLPTEYDKFNIRRLNPGPKNEIGDDFTQNVYAWIEGSDPVLKDEIVVVGGHMDHIGFGTSFSRTPRRQEVHPGADDNASGTVAVMAVAEAFARMGPQKRTIVFQWYSAEEMGLIGSRHYVNNPTFPRGNPDIKKHVFMCNSDMIGYLGRGVYSVGFYDGNSSIDIGRYIDELNQIYPFAKKITSRGSGGSDHANFYNKQIPVAFLHTGGHPYYHTPDDTPDKINYEGIEKISKYMLELVYKVANADVKPAFNYNDFKPMSVTHDHGHKGNPFYIHSYHKHDHGHTHHGHGHTHSHHHGHHDHSHNHEHNHDHNDVNRLPQANPSKVYRLPLPTPNHNYPLHRRNQYAR